MHQLQVTTDTLTRSWRAEDAGTYSVTAISYCCRCTQGNLRRPDYNPFIVSGSENVDEGDYRIHTFRSNGVLRSTHWLVHL